MPDAALDATAEALARQILRDLPADGPRTRAHVAGLPAPVAGLLNARLDTRVDRAAAPPDTPWVDADDERLRTAVQTWRDAARAAARFPAGAWAEAADRAARLALAHLIRPAETLAAYAFEGDDEALPAALALRRIRAFGPYPYLPDIAARYADRKGLGRIDRDGLERLLQRIDRRMLRAFGADDWLTLLEPLYDLVGPLGSPPGTVPAPLLQALFRARGADALADAIEGADTLTPDALRQRIAPALLDPEPPAASGPFRAPEAPAAPAPDEVPHLGSAYHDPDAEPADDSQEIGPSGPALPTADEDGADTEAPDAPTTLVFPRAGEDVRPPLPAPEGEATAEDDVPADAEAAPPAAPVAEPAAPSPPPADEEDEPLWRRLARQQGAVDAAPEAHPAGDDEEDVPLWKRFAPPAADAPPPGPSPGLATARPTASLDVLESRVLGPNADDRRTWFIDELFGGSADDYHQTLLALDSARTWTEATQIIARDVFRQHRVNIYSEPAVAFTDAVEARMAARG